MIRHIGVALGVFHPHSLVPFLSNPDDKIRWEVADSLSDLADASVIEPIFEALRQESNGHVIKRLVWALETAKAWDKLLLCLEFSSWLVQSYAAEAIARNGERRFILPLLNRMIETDDLMHIYYGALYRLVDESTVQPLLQALSKVSSTKLRGKILTLLGRTKDPQTLNILVASLNEKENSIRDGAALGLLYLGDNRAIEPLRTVFEEISSAGSDIGNVKFALSRLEKEQAIS
jgi:HEAT repeat protein